MVKKITVEIDELGRIGLAPELLSALHLSAGSTLVIELQKGKIVLEPLPEEPELLEKDGILVVRPRLTGNIADGVRQERNARIAHLSKAR